MLSNILKCHFLWELFFAASGSFSGGRKSTRIGNFSFGLYFPFLSPLVPLLLLLWCCLEATASIDFSSHSFFDPPLCTQMIYLYTSFLFLFRSPFLTQFVVLSRVPASSLSISLSHAFPRRTEFTQTHQKQHSSSPRKSELLPPPASLFERKVSFFPPLLPSNPTRSRPSTHPTHDHNTHTLPPPRPPPPSLPPPLPRPPWRTWWKERP